VLPEVRLIKDSSGSTGQALVFDVHEYARSDAPLNVSLQPRGSAQSWLGCRYKKLGGVVSSVRTYQKRSIHLAPYHFGTRRPDDSVSRQFPYLNILSVLVTSNDTFSLSFVHDGGLALHTPEPTSDSLACTRMLQEKSMCSSPQRRCASWPSWAHALPKPLTSHAPR
jgi:hypothetical protein